MPIELIEDPDDVRLAPFRLNDRGLSHRGERANDDAPGRFLAEGDLVVERALAAGCRPVAALVDAARPPGGRILERFTAAPGAGGQPAAVFGAGDALRRQVARMGRVQPIIAVFERPTRPTPSAVIESADRLVVLEAVDNPGNVGAIVRNAAALGWAGLLLDRTSADPLARRSLRVAMGTAFAVRHARSDDLVATLRDLTGAGWVTVALTLEADAADLATIEPGPRCAVVIGAERTGLSAPVLAACGLRARIPMHPAVDSLNTAAASAIACYQLRRR